MVVRGTVSQWTVSQWAGSLKRAGLIRHRIAVCDQIRDHTTHQGGNPHGFEPDRFFVLLKCRDIAPVAVAIDATAS